MKKFTKRIVTLSLILIPLATIFLAVLLTLPGSLMGYLIPEQGIYQIVRRDNGKVFLRKMIQGNKRGEFDVDKSYSIALIHHFLYWDTKKTKQDLSSLFDNHEFVVITQSLTDEMLLLYFSENEEEANAEWYLIHFYDPGAWSEDSQYLMK